MITCKYAKKSTQCPKLTSHSKLSLAMKDDITGGFREMRTKHDMLSVAMKEDITVGFEEMKTSRSGRY